jgi:glycosyltransferase involved in cell wall biosynthesis
MNQHILMLCHDQHLDRRVIAQGRSLTQLGHQVTLLCLSHNSDDGEEHLPEGIHLIRIGLRHIIPDNKIYKNYMIRQKNLNHLLNQLCNKVNKLRSFWAAGFKLSSRLNWMTYKTVLCMRYLNRTMGDPLPFKSAFVTAASGFNPDLIQVHDLPALAAGVELAKKWMIPLVYDAHEFYPEQRSFSFIQRRVCARAEKELIESCTTVFAVNDSIAQEMATRYSIPRPITLINAMDPPAEYHPNTSYNILRDKLKLDASRKILLFQGGFSPHRNLEQLIKAMALIKHPDIDLVMMGFGDFDTALKEKANRLGLLNKRIYFLPAVPQSELLQHSASADVGIIPYPHVDLNSYYCTPNKLFEFIQAGLPILANDSPELRRFVHDTGFGLVKPMRSSHQIAAAIDEIFMSARLYESYKKHLKEQRYAFTWQVQSSVYLGAIKYLLNEKMAFLENNRANYKEISV